ncbi:MAG: hypothetical protein WC979_06910 [Candidatus Pacearchaeota archaeon]|jgi:hypothetical protein
MINISILHPTRERPKIAYDNFCKWIASALDPGSIEYFIGVDNDDPLQDTYKDIFKVSCKGVQAIVYIGESRNPVAAVNNLSKYISDTTQILVEVVDDVEPCTNWDKSLFEKLQNVDNFNQPKSIGTHDGLRGYGIVFTQPIMNRAFFEKFGYFIYPEYTSMCADNDFTELSRRSGYLIDAPEILFKHRHYSIGLSIFDKTYARNNNPTELERNRKVYAEREKNNFGL